MEWKELAVGLTNIAPTIGSFFGPIGAGVGTAVSALAKAFGLKSDAKPDEILAAVRADPQALLKLELAKMEYELSIGKEETERLRIELADVKDARAREIEVTKITGKRDTLQFGLAVLGVIGPLSLVTYMIVKGLPGGMSTDAAAMIGAFIGIVIGEYKTIFQYFFGSSKGSQVKTEFLEKQARNGR
jgi:hypothetical protein